MKTFQMNILELSNRIKTIHKILVKVEVLCMYYYQIRQLYQL